MSDGGMNLGDFSMLGLFRMEAETQTAVLDEGLLALEEDPSNPERVESLMRASHSLKGAARIVQLDEIVAVAHAMEDYFVAAGEGRITPSGDGIDRLLKAVDMFKSLSGLDDAGVPAWIESNKTELAALAAEFRGLKDAPQSPPPEKPPPSENDDDVEPVPAEPTKASPPPEESEPHVAAETADESPKRTERHADASSGLDSFVRVTADKLNRLMGLAGESIISVEKLNSFNDDLLVLRKKLMDLETTIDHLRGDVEESSPIADSIESLRGRFQAYSRHFCDHLGEFASHSRAMDHFSNRFYNEVVSTRMRPFSEGVGEFPRMVRDLARKLGKKVRFSVVGETTDVDRDVLERLNAPLTHLIRNAIDHGLEMPEERVAKGKPETGEIRVSARHWAGMLHISISDDGKGIDIDKLRRKIVKKGLSNEKLVETMTEAELLEFMFLPGFSTSESVTEISGRGVGLDVVQDMVNQTRGVVHAENRPGAGAVFHLQLPITLSVIRSLLVEIAGAAYAFPMVRIDRIVKARRDETSVLENRQYLPFDGEDVGLVSARQILELDDGGDEDADELSIIIVSDRLSRYGVVVDRFIEERELVTEPLDRRLGKLPDVNAGAVTEDGVPVLVVDIDDLVRTIDALLTGGRLRHIGSGSAGTGDAGPKRVLIVDDSITVREVERRLLENRGYAVDVAVDGMDGWNAIRANDYDLIVSDIDMPRMNGFELVETLKRHATLGRIPVIIVSYKDREEDRRRGLEVGADYYLTKSSFQDDTLLRAVEDLIGEAER